MPAELQQGAVSGLVDAEDTGATVLLVKALPDLSAGNRNFALAGLLRTPAAARQALRTRSKRERRKPGVASEGAPSRAAEARRRYNPHASRQGFWTK